MNLGLSAYKADTLLPSYGLSHKMGCTLLLYYFSYVNISMGRLISRLTSFHLPTRDGQRERDEDEGREGGKRASYFPTEDES